MSETSSPDKAVSEASAADTASDKATTGAPQRQRVAKHGKGGAWTALFMVVIAAGAGAGGYFLWQQLQTARQGLAADNQALAQKLDTFAGRLAPLGQLEQQVGALQGSISALQSQQQALEEAMGKLRSDAMGSARTWDVEEIAALLQIANDRLRLEGDADSSLAALEAADGHLRQLKNPALLEVRRLLAEEINALRATAIPDIAGMALSLGALANGVDRLSIAGDESSQAQPASAAGSEKGWRGMLHDFWEQLKSLVVIKRRGEGERPMLAPDERYFLRQNLRLDLEAARLALLQRDSRSYQSSLREAREWVGKYFDNADSATASTLKELDRLQAIDIAPSLPDISASLNALQSWLERQRRQKPPAAESTPP